jgi:His/Glu/Gln/Arg/opine family amino acid ABC transporter permease subunit
MFNWLTPEILAILGKGLWFTLVLTLVTSLLAMVIGVLVGSLRLWGARWLVWGSTLFVETFRNIPALVLIIFFAFAFPNAFAPPSRQALFFDNGFINWLGRVAGLSIPWYALAAALGLTLNTAAYIAELFRAGVSTLPREQVDAARSMGASWGTIFRVILIPGGLRAAYPAITSRLIHNMKNTALASIVAVPEFFNSVTMAINRSFMAIEFLTLAAILYLALAAGMTLGLRWLERWLYPRRTAKASSR